jgi:PAS domain S-box-containing protein
MTSANQALDNTILNRLSAWLIDPFDALSDLETSKTRLLAVVLLLFVAVTGVYAVLARVAGTLFVTLSDLDFAIAVAIVIPLVVAYLLCRTRFYYWGGLLAVLSLTAMIFAVAIPQGGSSDVGILYYLTIVLIFAGMFLSIRELIGLAVGYIVLLLLMVLVLPADHGIQSPLFFNIAMLTMIVVAFYLRQRMTQIQQMALAESEGRYRHLVTHSPDAAVILVDGQIVFVNLQGLALFGAAEAGQIEGQPLDAFIHAEEQSPGDDGVQHLPAGRIGERHNTTFTLRRLDGSRAHIDAVAINMMYRDQAAVLISMRDVTAQQAAEESLKQHAKRLEIIRNIDEGILGIQPPAQIATNTLGRLYTLLPYTRSGVLAFDFDAQEAQLLARCVDGKVSSPPDMVYPLNTMSEYQVDQTIPISYLQMINAELDTARTASRLTIPLSVKGDLIGLFYLADVRPNVFTEETAVIVREVADQLAIALQQARLHEQIRAYAEDLEQRITDRTATLNAANARLLELMASKDDFVSNVSHELRTPISSLKLRLYLLDKQPARAETHLDVMGRELDRLDDIIESLLYLSRLDQDRVKFEPVPTDVNVVARTITGDRVPLAESNALTLCWTPSPDLPPVPCDAALLGQAVSILLTNALNYTPAGGTISVSTLVTENGTRPHVGICVRDTGLGIAPQEIDLLFDRFYRGTAGQDSGQTGTGLGLSIVQEIVSLHNGYINVDSKGPGHGAEFTIWLPA